MDSYVGRIQQSFEIARRRSVVRLNEQSEDLAKEALIAREDVPKDERTKQIEDEEEAKLLKDQNDEIRILRDAAYRKMRDLLKGRKLASDLEDETGSALIAEGTKITDAVLDDVLLAAAAWQRRRR